MFQYHIFACHFELFDCEKSSKKYSEYLLLIWIIYEYLYKMRQWGFHMSDILDMKSFFHRISRNKNEKRHINQSV